MTKYVICREAIGQRGEIVISEADYHALADSIKILGELSDLEEKFNTFI